LGQVVRLVLVPGRRIRLAFPVGGHISRGLDKMNRAEKYYAQYAPQRRVSNVIAVTPAAMEFEKRAISRENKGQYRLAARLWLECMDAAMGEVERARIAVRRQQCITKGNRTPHLDYSGIGCRGVVYD
jgi:hypothetical protein